MNNFKEEYSNELENELTQFLFLCTKKDAQILLSQTKNNYSVEHLRLASICIVLGYRKLLLKIFALAEKNSDCFFKGLETLSGNFAQLDKWVTDFIENIELPEAQNIVREYWQNRKETLDLENFNIKQLL